MAIEQSAREEKLLINTIITGPGMPSSVYETSTLVHPGESVNKVNIINMLTGHLALLTEELNSLKGKKP